MSHLIDITTGEAAFTRRLGSQAAWHLLGGQTPADAPLEVWAENAKLNFDYRKTTVEYSHVPDSGMVSRHVMLGRNVIYRSDTKQALSVVSERYRLVQPREVLGFFRELIKDHGFVMETAGALKDGQQIWALASTGQSTLVKGIDKVNQYLLLSTSVDGKTATQAQFTSVRVVCNNTLSAAMANAESFVRVNHMQEFNAADVRRRLGLAPEVWGQFARDAERLASIELDKAHARRIIESLVQPADWEADRLGTHPSVLNIYNLYAGNGQGANLSSASNTAWGLLNAITEFVDYRGQGKVDARLSRMWFGSGRALKDRAWNEILKLAA